MGMSEEEFFEAMKKMGGTQTPDDENKMVNTTAELYEDDAPAQSDMDAGRGKATNFGDATIAAFRASREDLLNRMFSHKADSDSAEQALISQSLEHGRTGDFETSSPQLSEKSKVKIAAVPATLTERVRGLTGHR